jgi:cytochrome c biogenesis protein CcmG/thiol:disulfide interchange protein DsbE
MPGTTYQPFDPDHPGETSNEAAEPSSRSVLVRVGQVVAAVVSMLFLGLLVYGVLAKASDTAIDDQLSTGQAPRAPAFALPVLDRGSLPPGLTARLSSGLADGRLTSTELHGTPFILNFWASWCLPCRDEAPVLQRGWRESNGRVLVLGLDMQDLSDDARAFIRSFGLSYPSVRDRGNDVARRFGVTGVPETFFVTASGRIAGHVIGVVSPAQLRTGMDAARSGRVRPALSGGAIKSQP